MARTRDVRAKAADSAYAVLILASGLFAAAGCAGGTQTTVAQPPATSAPANTSGGGGTSSSSSSGGGLPGGSGVSDKPRLVTCSGPDLDTFLYNSAGPNTRVTAARRGQILAWRSESATKHTIEIGLYSASTSAPIDAVNFPLNAAGDQQCVTFDMSGTYEFRCLTHPNEITGTVQVSD